MCQVRRHGRKRHTGWKELCEQGLGKFREMPGKGNHVTWLEPSRLAGMWWVGSQNVRQSQVVAAVQYQTRYLGQLVGTGGHRFVLSSPMMGICPVLQRILSVVICMKTDQAVWEEERLSGTPGEAV